MGLRPIPSSPHLYTLASDRGASSGKIGGKMGLFEIQDTAGWKEG